MIRSTKNDFSTILAMERSQTSQQKDEPGVTDYFNIPLII
jgi:hypothetical protein